MLTDRSSSSSRPRAEAAWPGGASQNKTQNAHCAYSRAAGPGPQAPAGRSRPPGRVGPPWLVPPPSRAAYLAGARCCPVRAQPPQLPVSLDAQCPLTACECAMHGALPERGGPADSKAHVDSQARGMTKPQPRNARLCQRAAARAPALGCAAPPATAAQTRPSRPSQAHTAPASSAAPFAVVSATKRLAKGGAASALQRQQPAYLRGWGQVEFRPPRLLAAAGAAGVADSVAVPTAGQNRAVPNAPAPFSPRNTAASEPRSEAPRPPGSNKV